MNSTAKSNIRALAFKNYYPKIEYPGPDFLKNTGIIRNLISASQQATIMQAVLTEGYDGICNCPRLLLPSIQLQRVSRAHILTYAVTDIIKCNYL